MIRIKNNRKESQLEIKRFYLDFTEIEVTCPHCREVFEYDNEYISYPDVNKFIELYMYCRNCDNEWNEELRIDLGITTKEEYDRQQEESWKTARFNGG